jgi:phage portal protein BeeE
LKNKALVFNENQSILDTKEFKAVLEVKPYVIETLKEYADKIGENHEFLALVQMTDQVSKAFNLPKIDLKVVETFTVPEKVTKDFFTAICEQELVSQELKNLRESFSSEYAGINKAHKIGVLEQGLKYTRIGVEPEAAQFLESRRFSVEEIARWYRIPPHMLADLERATFSNIEHQSMAYVRQTLVPWLVRYEQELARKLFEPSEMNSLYIKFNVEGLLRGDAMTRAEYNSKLFNIGALSVNEIREKEDLNPVEGGDEYFINTSLTKVSLVGEEKQQEDEGNQEL